MTNAPCGKRSRQGIRRVGTPPVTSFNSGVPQHVIQRLLGHASPGMTSVYAHLHDSTIRAEFERYCQTRVDVQGRLLGFDPEAVSGRPGCMPGKSHRVVVGDPTPM